MARILIFSFLFGLIGSATLVQSQVLSMTQTPVMNTAMMGTPGYFFTGNANVMSWQADGDAQRIDLQYTAYKGRFGQTLISNPQNWTGANFVTMTIQNTQTYWMKMAYAISTVNDGNNFDAGYYAEFDLPPMSTKRYVLFFDEPVVPDAQMKNLPKPFDGDFTRVDCWLPTNLASIKHWRLINMTATGGRIIISSMRHGHYSLNLVDVVDQFFQYTGRSWTGKANSIADLQADAAAEQVDLLANPNTGELLGTTSLPNQGANPKWRTTKINNKWFFVHPNGRPFWSFGLNGVHDMMCTKIAGRTHLFEDVPSPTGPNADLYWTPPGSTVGQLYRVTAHNMRAKYPGEPSLRQKFVALANQRMNSWGVNTISAGAVDEVYDNSRPYVLLLDTLAFSPHIPAPTTVWAPPPDPYAPSFQSWMTTQFSQRLTGHNGRSNFMGVFVDNELSWGHPSGTLIDRYSIALGVMKAPANQPAKTELIRAMTRKYRTVSRLNSAWRRSFSSFNAMNSVVNITNPADITASMGRDLEEFQYRFASAYFTKVRAALNASGCTALYLGCRFWHQTPEVVLACSNSVDVMSFNNYAMPENYNWTFLNSMRKPVLISEWSVNVDEGPTLGFVYGMTRPQRGQKVRDMFQRALSEPNIIGMHWFQMYDMAVTNRGYDTENHGLGVVDVTDKPHQEVVDAYRWGAANIYTIRR